MMHHLFDISRTSFVDGPGIRTTFFYKGCNLKCAWCHNPESQSAKDELLFYAEKCTGCGACQTVCPSPEGPCLSCGKCAEVCPVNARRIAGKCYETEELMKIVLKDKDYFSTSGGGVTLSGGECMLYPEEVAEFSGRLKEENISVAVDTAGNVPWSSFEKVLPFADLFLYDLKSMEDEVHRRYVGVGNERILENYRKLIRSGAKVWVRVPLIPGVNDGEENLTLLRGLLREYRPLKTEILPYHRMGEGKYASLQREVVRFDPPAKEELERIRKMFKDENGI